MLPNGKNRLLFQTQTGTRTIAANRESCAIRYHHSKRRTIASRDPNQSPQEKRFDSRLRLCSTLLTSPTLRCPGDVPGDGPRTSEVATIVAKGRLAAQPKQGAEPNWVSRGAETGRQSETPPTTLVFNWEEVQSTSWTNLELRSQGKQADFGSAGQTEG